METSSPQHLSILERIGKALGLGNIYPGSGLIFITGGTGVIGHRVAQRLLDVGYSHVRLGTKHPEGLGDLMKPGAETVDFAWGHEESYEKALKGVKSVLCTVPYIDGWKDHFPAFFNACKNAGVKHFVKLSFYHARDMAGPMQEIPLARDHGICDNYVVEELTPRYATSVMTGDMDVGNDFIHPEMAFTILYASHYMSNPFIFQRKHLESAHPGFLYGASENHGVNYVSPNDVAEVAVRVLLERKSHSNKEYLLTGPESIIGQQVAYLLSEHLQKPIAYIDQPLEKYAQEMEHIGEASWVVRDLAAMEKIKASGIEEAKDFLSGDIEIILGRKPESFKEYLERTDTMTPVEAGAPLGIAE
ncbi:hypothetical protein FisN_1Hh194 [Fistulifera solaris]|uniref:NAD(P)-binding domain-containing protein n=1 Tax=Fistulifera solaris TaxID=1519565 RepID=A0A1Z5JE34_FISSO|nr:hypothetical protein FisN_1Hh194 [Fistulifera solaris]|eukprot:GAX12263.1 hypothetical protein FisN_1Hh194 [Fistulifera solaris]